MAVLEIICTILSLLLIYRLLRLWQENQNLPPGPNGLLFLGYLPKLNFWPLNDPKKVSAALEGPLFSYRVGSKLYVLLNTYETIRDAFHVQGDIFNHRPEDQPGLFYPMKFKGVAWSSGERWKIHRRYTGTSLRDFGMGKLSLNGKILEEIDSLSEQIRSIDGKPFDPIPLFMNAASNIICNIILGERYDYDNPEFGKLVGIVNESFVQRARNAPIINVFPWITHFRPFRKHVENTQEMVSFLTNHILQHRESGKRDDFLGAMIEEAEKPGHKSEILSDGLLESMWSLFAAGTDTTAATMQWIVLYMIQYPEIHERIRQEVLDVAAELGQMPSYEDRELCPFTEATIMEVQRLSNVAIATLPHTNTREAHVSGYRIPKGSVVHANMKRVHEDSSVWGSDVKSFKPERFLTSDGKADYKNNSFMPFGMGKRICLGNSLAKMELFLLTTQLLSKYRFNIPDGMTAPKLDIRVPGMVSHPESFTVCATIWNTIS